MTFRPRSKRDTVGVAKGRALPVFSPPGFAARVAPAAHGTSKSVQRRMAAIERGDAMRCRTKDVVTTRRPQRQCPQDSGLFPSTFFPTSILNASAPRNITRYSYAYLSSHIRHNF